MNKRTKFFATVALMAGMSSSKPDAGACDGSAVMLTPADAGRAAARCYGLT